MEDNRREFQEMMDSACLEPERGISMLEKVERRVAMRKKGVKKGITAAALTFALIIVGGSVISYAAGEKPLDMLNRLFHLADFFEMDENVADENRTMGQVLKAQLDDTQTLENAIEILMREDGEFRYQTFVDGSHLEHVWDDKNGDTLAMIPERNTIYYSSGIEDSKEYMSVFNMLGQEGGMYYRFPEQLAGVPDEEVPGYSREQAIKDSAEVVRQLGIEVGDIPAAVFGISGATYREICERERYWLEPMENAMGDEMPVITDEDGVYQVVWNTEFNGVPIVSSNYSEAVPYGFEWRMGVEGGSCVRVILNQKGIISLVSEHYQYKVVGEEEPQEIITFEMAANVAAEYYASKGVEDREVVKIKYVYIPVVTNVIEEGVQYDLDLVPGWCIESSYTHSYGRKCWEAIYIDAITGEILPNRKYGESSY